MIMHLFCCVSTVHDRNSGDLPAAMPPATSTSAVAGSRSDDNHVHNHDYARLSERMAAPSSTAVESSPRVPAMLESTQLLCGDQREVKINDIVDNGMSGILYKWVNYGRGWRRRWFELQDGVVSYYKIHGHDKIVLSQETENGSRIVGEDSLRLIARHENGSSQLRRKPVGEVHLKVSSIRESRSDDKRFSIFTGIKRLHLRAETREDRVAWMNKLQAVKDMFPRLSNSELMAPVDNVVLSTEKLRQQLLEESVSEAAIRDSEQIMRNEFDALQNQLMLLKQKHCLLLDTLRQLEVHVMISRKNHANRMRNSSSVSSAQNPVHPSASETPQINSSSVSSAQNFAHPSASDPP